MQSIPNFYAGLSGLQLPVPKYQFPAEHQNSSRLTYYATFFNSIEVNSSFYKIPMKSTVAKWSSSVPENFRFTFKMLQDVSHCKALQYDPTDIHKFFETIAQAGDKSGSVLLQFPPSLKSGSLRQFEQLLADVKQADTESKWPLAVEFRDKSWYHDEVFEIISSYDAALVFQDIPKSITPLSVLTSDVVYLRFHGPTGNYRGSYTEAYLQEYAEYVKEWLADGRKVFLYFNNTAGDAFHNLRLFQEMMHA